MLRVSEPVFGQTEYENLVNCLKRRWITNGPMVREFEEKFATYCNKKYAVACTNATSGMHLALLANRIGKGHTVVVPTFTMIATALAAYYTGATLEFVDAELDTWCMDIEKLPNKYDVIMPVHIYGHPVIPFKTDAYVIEDCAEGLGAVPIGWGDVQVYSFYANKIITCGEGGMLVTDDPLIAGRARHLGNMAFGEGEDRFIHTEIGYNYRMTDLQAAVGLAQLERIEAHVNKKRKIAVWYSQRLKDSCLRLPAEKEWATNVYWMYGVVLPRGISRHIITNSLNAVNIETRPFFYPMHLQPCFKNVKGDFPVAEYLSEYGFYLPSGLGLEEKDIDHVCEELCRILK